MIKQSIKQSKAWAALALFITLPAAAQRTVSSFRDYAITLGQSRVIDGEKRTEPDIYFQALDDGTYTAHRLTVRPSSTQKPVGQPYLQCMTPTSVDICWLTHQTPAAVQLLWGESEEELTESTRSYDHSELSTTYHWNTIHLDGLQPDHVYYYRLRSNGVTSATSRFRTLPEAGAERTMRFLLIGDHQRNETSDYEWLLQAARRRLDEKYGPAPLEDHVSALINVGDQVDYGDLSHYEQNHLFKNRSVMSSLPIQTAVGNHELKGDPDVQLYESHYAPYRRLAYQGIESGTAKWYAYQAGCVLWVILDSDHTTAEQKMWVRRVVAAADQDPTVSFIVSVQHRPLYAEMYAYDVSPWALDEIMPILSSSPKHVLNCAGHHHLYSRGQLTDLPLHHLISGGGVGTYVEGYEQMWGVCLVDNVDRDEVEKTIDQNTYLLLEFDPERHTMNVETYAIGNRRLVCDGEMVDHFQRDLTPSLPLGTDTIQMQVEWARDEAFADVVLHRLMAREDYYGVDNAFRPLNIISRPFDTAEVERTELPNGTYYKRTRARDSNLQWGPWSEGERITVAGSQAQAKPTIGMERTFYRKGDDVTVTFRNAPVGTDAWVGIYVHDKKPGSNDRSYAYEYTRVKDGTLTFKSPAVDEYFAVLFKDGGYTEASERITFYVTESYNPEVAPFAMQTDHVAYAEGDPVLVGLQNAPCLPKDWVGIYAEGTVPRSSTCPTYLYNSTPTTTLKLNAEGTKNWQSPLAEGIYFVGYFTCDSYTEPFARRHFIVGQPVALVPLRESFIDEEWPTFLYEGLPPSSEEASTKAGSPVAGNSQEASTKAGSPATSVPAQLCRRQENGWQPMAELTQTGDTVRIPPLSVGHHELAIVVEGRQVSPLAELTITSPTGLGHVPEAIAPRDAQPHTPLYNLVGQRIAHPAPGTIHIAQGRKVLQK